MDKEELRDVVADTLALWSEGVQRKKVVYVINKTYGVPKQLVEIILRASIGKGKQVLELF